MLTYQRGSAFVFYTFKLLGKCPDPSLIILHYPAASTSLARSKSASHKVFSPFRSITVTIGSGGGPKRTLPLSACRNASISDSRLPAIPAIIEDCGPLSGTSSNRRSPTQQNPKFPTFSVNALIFFFRRENATTPTHFVVWVSG